MSIVIKALVIWFDKSVSSFYKICHKMIMIILFLLSRYPVYTVIEINITGMYIGIIVCIHI